MREHVSIDCSCGFVNHQPPTRTENQYYHLSRKSWPLRTKTFGNGNVWRHGLSYAKQFSDQADFRLWNKNREFAMHCNQFIRAQTRREMLLASGCGFGHLALASMAQKAMAQKVAADQPATPAIPARAKRVIFLFM